MRLAEFQPLSRLCLLRELELKQLQNPKIKEIAEQLGFSDHPKFELI